jgi:hypothetical protein
VRGGDNDAAAVGAQMEHGELHGGRGHQTNVGHALSKKSDAQHQHKQLLFLLFLVTLPQASSVASTSCITQGPETRLSRPSTTCSPV